MTDPFFDPLFLSGFLSLVMFDEGHGGPAQLLRARASRPRGPSSELWGRYDGSAVVVQWWCSGGHSIHCTSVQCAYNIVYVCVWLCVFVCIYVQGTTVDVRATAAGAGGGGRDVGFESQPISVGKKNKTKHVFCNI